MEDKVGNLVREYKEGFITRREFIQRASVLVGGTVLATAMVETLPFDAAAAAVVEPGDPSLDSAAVEFPGDGTVIHGYLSRPKKKAEKRAGLIIIHENRGLSDFIRDVSRRAAKEGFVALAPDLLSVVGGTGRFSSSEEAAAAVRRLSSSDVMKELQASFDYLKKLEGVVPNKIGVMGFCWGGGNSLLFSTQNAELASTVVFYGRNPDPIDLVRKLPGPFLGIYGELDERITSKVPELEQALKKYHKAYEIRIYPGAQHAFLNDTNPSRYNAAAARDAWLRAVAFLKATLKS